MLDVPSIIRKKRDGHELTADEMRSVLVAYTVGEVPDYQMSALLMAIYFSGMQPAELDVWTDVMLHSGKVLDLSDIEGPKIDKHSTGGVGDKVSLMLAPIAAACGVKVPMISGRGLGHTGGTLDKLESIPGFNVSQKESDYRRIVAEAGLVFAGQTDDLCPSDRKLYALRDVTGTVESIPLISSSIMSKKLAEGIDALVLDVKVGKGAFMKTLEDARTLARTMVRIGEGGKKSVKAVLTWMDTPLGCAAGNSVEVAESVEVLKGGGPEDLREVVLTLTGWMLVLGGIEAGLEQAVARCQQSIDSGEALERLIKVVEMQGGDPRAIEDTSRLPLGTSVRELKAPRSGWIVDIDAMTTGRACVLLGAGRLASTDAVDHGAGVVLAAKPGVEVAKGDLLATMYASEAGRLGPASEVLSTAFAIGSERPELRASRIIEVI